jgi:hypothetical protein
MLVPSITRRLARATGGRHHSCITSSHSHDVRSGSTLGRTSSSALFRPTLDRHHLMFHLPSDPSSHRTFAVKSNKKGLTTKNLSKKVTSTKSNPKMAAPARYYLSKKAAAKKLNAIKENTKDKKADSRSNFGNINGIFRCCANQDKVNDLHSSEIIKLWSSIPRLLKKERFVHDKEEHVVNLSQKIQCVSWLMERTAGIIDECNQSELTDIILHLGETVDEVQNAGEESSMYHNVFHELFFGNKHPLFGEIDEELLKPFAVAARGRLSLFHPRDLTRLSQAFAMMGHDPQFEDGATLLGETAFETMIQVDEFSPKVAADILHAFAKMKLPVNDLLFQSVGDSIAERDGLNVLPPSTIAQIVTAYATSQIPHQKLFDKMGDSICGRDDLASFKPSELSAVLRSYASLNQANSAMFQKFGDNIVASKDLGIMRKFQPSDLISTLWSFTNLKESHPVLFAKIADAILKLNRNALSSEELATAVWAYAAEFERNDFVWNSSFSCKSLFKKLGDILAFRDLTSCSPDSINNAIWAYATCNISHSILFEKIGDASAARDDLAPFAPNIVWAYATLDESHPVLSDPRKVMCHHDFLADMSTVDLAKTLFPNEQDSELFVEVADHLANRDDLYSLGPQSLLNLLVACTNIKPAHSALLQSVGDTLTYQNDSTSFDAKFLSKIVWTFTASDENHPRLFKSIGDVFIKIGSSTSELDADDCVCLMWACAAANTSHSNVFAEIRTSIAARESDKYQVLMNELGDILMESKELSALDSPRLVNLVCAVSAINKSQLSSLKKMGDLLASRDDLTAVSTQALSNLLGFYANADSHHPLLFQKVGDVLALRDDVSTSHEVGSRIISSYTKHPAKPHIGLFKRIGEALKHDVDKNSSTMSDVILLDLLLALSAAKSTWPGLLQSIGDILSSRDVDTKIIKPRLTNILFAYTNAGVSHPGLFRKLAASNPSVFDLAQAVNEGFMPRVLLGLASAFAPADQKLLRHDKTDLFKVIGDAAVDHYRDISIVPQFSVEDVTKIVAAFGHAKVSEAVHIHS